MVQHFTELGLRINSARISSDGGWFHDVFLVTEAHGEKVRDPKKIYSIKQMLNVYMRDDDVVANGDDTDDIQRVETTVFELSGLDRAGLLSEVMDLFTRNGCDVRSAAVWTYKGRVAFVFSITEKGQPVRDQTKLEGLRQLVADILSSAGGSWTVRTQKARGEVHHDRRLHQLMLQEEKEEWERVNVVQNINASNRMAGDPESVLNGSNAGDARLASDPVDVLKESLRSPKFGRPVIDIAHCSHPDYWTVNIHCRDRTKLLFDTVCTLADMDFDIYHATVDCNAEGYAHQEYFIRPRTGEGGFNEDSAKLLKAMLESSIQRRFPKGLKVHVRSLDRFGCLASLAKQLHRANLSVTRAKVRTFATSNSSGHTLYVMNADGSPPNRARVQSALLHCGGKQADGSDLMGRKVQELASHRFSFAFTDRQMGIGGSPTDSYYGSL